MSKKAKRSISTFAILLAVLLLVSVATWIAAGSTYTDADGNTAEVVGATSSDIFMAPVNGFADAADVITFVFCLGAFLAIVTGTGALETGIQSLVRKLHGKELVLIWVLMFVFSVGGTTYGMGEETVGFYILLAATMMAAGFDPVVGAATVLLGAGTGVLGSTINPFATGAAVSAAADVGVEVNMGITYVIAIILWLVAYVISALFVTSYAKKVRANKGSILTAEQLSECKLAYGGKDDIGDVKLTGRQKAVLWLFALSFIVMILGFIPWGSLGEGAYSFFAPISSWLTGAGFGDWWFYDAATWFLLMGIIIGIVGLEDKGQLIKLIIAGFGDMVGVNLVIAMARATTVIMSTTGLGTWIVEASVTALSQSGVSAGVFGMLDYVLHVGLSFLVPSSSGLASLSSPIVSPIVAGMGWSVETAVMINVAANGLVNLFTPTCGFIMGGLALARVPYETWVKWAWKLLVTLFEMTYRYIGVLLEETSSMYTAYQLRHQKAKGLELRHMGSFVGSLLLRTFDRAGRIYSAMKCRGYGRNTGGAMARPWAAKDWAYTLTVSGLCVLCRVFDVVTLAGSWIGGLLP